jgi:outer membrane protein assembly factor BamB
MPAPPLRHGLWFAAALLAASPVSVRAGQPAAAPADAWPMFGGTPDRNMVNPFARGLADDWCVEEGKEKNLRWWVKTGTRGYGSPVVAGGRVFVATNNGNPRDLEVKGHKGILMCFAAKDAKFLWQAVHDMPPPPVDQQGTQEGLVSTPTVEGDRLYYVAPDGRIVCASVKDGKAHWRYDTMKELNVFPGIICICAPLVVGDRVFVVTGNGVDDMGDLPAPQAPSFIALDKKKGTLLWQSALPGKNIIEGQWSNPAYAEVNGKGQVIFPGGDGWLYGLEPASGSLIWKFNCNAKKDLGKVGPQGKGYYFMATPVVHGDRVYVGIGLHPENGAPGRVGHFWCIDLTKKGDVSPVNDNWDPQAPVNKDSALVWHYGGEILPRPKTGRSVVFGRTVSTAAIHDGLVYISEETGYLHCLDAKTGQKYWEHDFKSGVWGSPYWADGKVYVGVEDGDVYVFAHGRQKKLIRTIDMGENLSSTPAAAGGVLYVLTKSKLYAIGAK